MTPPDAPSGPVAPLLLICSVAGDRIPSATLAKSSSRGSTVQEAPSLGVKTPFRYPVLAAGSFRLAMS